MRNPSLKPFNKYSGLMKIARRGFPWEKTALIVALVTPLPMLGASATNAQPQDRPAQSESGQSIPDAPQPQKKPVSKPQPATSPGSAASPTASPSPAPPPSDKAAPPPATKNENPFPESVSRDAAKAAGDEPAGGDSSAGQSTTPAPDAKKHPSADENPFPESVSRDAAKAAGGSSDSSSGPEDNPKTAPKNDLPPGVSSSRSSGVMDDAPGETPKVTDPVLAKKDTAVGGYYLQTGNYQGALLRYKDAIGSDPANVDAIFGLAEAQHMLKQNAEAARNYQLYLDILPNGPKAKQALKSLKAIETGK